MVQTPDPRIGAGAPNPAPRPAVSPNAWAALDADYGGDHPAPPERLTQLPTVGFSGRFWKSGPGCAGRCARALRTARPARLAADQLLWQGFLPWVIMGLALIAYAIVGRRAFRQYGLGAQTWVYGAMGVGQLMLACSYIIALGPVWPFIGLYWLGVILTWGLIELRRVFGQRGSGSIF